MMSDVKKDQDLHFFCQQWAEWHRSRRLFAPPAPKHLLARFQPQKYSGEVPDAECSINMSLFNLAVMAQPDSEEKRTMQLFYLHNLRPIKAVANELGISSKTFYKRVKKFSQQAYQGYLELLAHRARAAKSELIENV